MASRRFLPFTQQVSGYGATVLAASAVPAARAAYATQYRRATVTLCRPTPPESVTVLQRDCR